MNSRPFRHQSLRFAATTLTVVLATRCALLQSIAVNKLGDSLARGGETFSSDDDPELVGDALPFSLKLMESLLAESPRHPGLLLASARGFTQYTYGWVEQPAAEQESVNPEAASQGRERARRLYLRACRYGLRGLDVSRPGFEARLRAAPRQALIEMHREQVPLLYWTAAAWGLAISNAKDQPELIADLPLVEAMIDRALELDETFDRGAIHVFLISYEPNRAGGEGDPLARSRRHFDRAVALSHGTLASPFVAFAENISVRTQQRAEFDDLLHRALAIDPAAHPESRLENQLAQHHAQWLLAHAADLFLNAPEGETK
jgi:predicted anti-sigma-YlaC factor YlaD